MSFILSLAKTIVKVYFSLFLIFHALIYFVPESVNYMVFQNIGIIFISFISNKYFFIST